MKKLIILLWLGMLPLPALAQKKVYLITDVTIRELPDGRGEFREPGEKGKLLNGCYRLNGESDSEYILAGFKKGLYHGKYQYYQRNTLQEEGTYVAGIQTGIYREYYRNGKDVKTELMFSGGKLDGKVSTYFTNGAVESEKEYRMGVEHGLERTYDYRTGRVLFQANYREGKPHGPWMQYLVSEEGSSIYKYNYSNGEMDGPWSETGIDGVPRGSGVYKNGKKTGVWTEYGKNGIPEKSTTYMNDVVNGEEKSYYPDGTVQRVDYYVNGKKEGMSRTFYAGSGRLKSEHTCKNGAEEGAYKVYDEDGTIREEGEYLPITSKNQLPLYRPAEKSGTGSDVWKDFTDEKGKINLRYPANWITFRSENDFPGLLLQQIWANAANQLTLTASRYETDSEYQYHKNMSLSLPRDEKGNPSEDYKQYTEVIGGLEFVVTENQQHFGHPSEPGYEMLQRVLHYFSEQDRIIYTFVMLINDDPARKDLDLLMESVELRK